MKWIQLNHMIQGILLNEDSTSVMHYESEQLINNQQLIFKEPIMNKDAVDNGTNSNDTITLTESLVKIEYANGICERCRKIIISDRAYSTIIAEAVSMDPLETGGILLGHYYDGIWYIVEATDPGINTFHSIHHHIMDDKYHNRVYLVTSRIYENELWLIGLWHRHPGSYNYFSEDDNKTNIEYSKAIGNGTLSILLNFMPDTQLTCYYLDYKESGCYFKPEIYIGDKYFKGTDYLNIASESSIMEKKDCLKKEAVELKKNE